MPALLYGLDACSLLDYVLADVSSLDFVVYCFLEKLFKTKTIDVVNYCRTQFNLIVSPLAT